MPENKRRADDAERLPAEELQWEEPAGRTVMDAADELRKDWQLNGTGPYADPTALGKLKALAEAATEGPWALEDGEAHASIAPAICLGSEIDEYGAPLTGLRIYVEEHHVHPARKPKIGGPAWQALANKALANAEFIAAANPAAVSSLIALISLQAARIAKLEKASQSVVDFAKPTLENMGFAYMGCFYKLEKVLKEGK